MTMIRLFWQIHFINSQKRFEAVYVIHFKIHEIMLSNLVLNSILEIKLFFVFSGCLDCMLTKKFKLETNIFVVELLYFRLNSHRCQYWSHWSLSSITFSSNANSTSFESFSADESQTGYNSLRWFRYYLWLWLNSEKIAHIVGILWGYMYVYNDRSKFRLDYQQMTI